MIRRLVEANYQAHQSEPTPVQVKFWLQELKTPQLLIRVATTYPEVAAQLSFQRPLLGVAKPEEMEDLEQALRAEEDEERKKDREYWLPLRA